MRYWPVATEPRGSHGFGYDPIFYFPEYGATFGEVGDARKALVEDACTYATKAPGEYTRRLAAARSAIARAEGGEG